MMTPDEQCIHCGRHGCWKHCQKSKDGKHEPDPTSFAPADCNAETGQMIIDVTCKLCGISGATSINPDDIDWE